MKSIQIFTLLISAFSICTSCNGQGKTKPIKQITETYYAKEGDNLVPTSTNKGINTRPYYQLFMPSDFYFPHFNESSVSEIRYIFQNNRIINCFIVGYEGKNIVYNYHYNSDGLLSAIETNGSRNYKFTYSKDLIEFSSGNYEIKLFTRNGKVYKSVDDGKNGEWNYTYSNNSIIADVHGTKIEFNYNKYNDLESIKSDKINITYLYKYDKYKNWTTQEIKIPNTDYTEDTIFTVKREIIYEN